MITRFFIVQLMERAQKEYPRWYRALNLIGTIVFVFLALPFLYLYTGCYIEQYVCIPLPVDLANTLAILSLLCGGSMIVWTLLLQYRQGQGSGSHMVPTKKLIVQGPYKIMRHPMLFGAVFFYFGTGTLFASLVVGLYSALVTGVLAYFFACYVEEPVLVARFGAQYKQYQKEVPFCPCLPPCPNNCNREHKTGD